jgi:hypothetical protein
MPANNQSNIIIYNSTDGRVSVSLYAQDGMVWMTQNQLAKLFNTSKKISRFMPIMFYKTIS